MVTVEIPIFIGDGTDTEGLAAQNRENHPRFEGWVRGMIAYVAMVNPERGRELLAEFELRKR